jgi:hypothetical protein
LLAPYQPGATAGDVDVDAIGKRCDGLLDGDRAGRAMKAIDGEDHFQWCVLQRPFAADPGRPAAGTRPGPRDLRQFVGIVERRQ